MCSPSFCRQSLKIRRLPREAALSTPGGTSGSALSGQSVVRAPPAKPHVEQSPWLLCALRTVKA